MSFLNDAVNQSWKKFQDEDPRQTYADSTQGIYQKGSDAGAQYARSVAPGPQAWNLEEGPSRYGQQMMDSALALKANQYGVNAANQNANAIREQQNDALHLLYGQQHNAGPSVASLQAQAQREAFLRQASRGGSPLAAMQAQQASGQQGGALGAQAVQSGLSEKMNARNAYLQAMQGIRGQDISRIGQAYGQDAAANQWALQQEKLATGGAKTGLAEREAIYKSMQDYEQYKQAQRKSEEDRAMAAYLGQSPTTDGGFNYGALISGIGGFAGAMANMGGK